MNEIQVIDQTFEEFAEIMAEIEAIHAEIPQLKELEKRAEAVKKEIQDYAKVHGEYNAAGYKVVLSERATWDTKKLEAAHPELMIYKNSTKVASVKKAGEK